LDVAGGGGHHRVDAVERRRNRGRVDEIAASQLDAEGGQAGGVAAFAYESAHRAAAGH
jgi:hypothetical protein